MTVLHVLATTCDLDGPARATEESVAASLAAGHSARLWVSAVPGIRQSGLKERLRRRGIPFDWREDTSPISPAALRSLWSAARSIGPSAVLHSHSERSLLWSRAVARAAGLRHVHTHHRFAAHDGLDAQRLAVTKRLFQGLDAVLVPHGSVGEGLVSTKVVPPCIDADLFAASLPDREALRRQLGVGATERMYLYLGRLSQERGADRLGLVQAALQARSEAARLFVAGSGPFSPGVEAMTAVRHLGHRPDSAALIAAADVLVLPFRTCGMPMVALEAAAVGTPVAAFAVGGLAGTGLALTVPEGDVDRLVDGAVHLVRDPELRAAAVARARGLLAQALSPGAHAAALAAI